MSINVLEIGTDRFTLGDNKRESLIRDRRKKTADQLQSLTLILSATNHSARKSTHIFEDKNLEVYYQAFPSIYYLFNIFYPFIIYKIGKKVCKSKKIDVISSQDSFVSALVGYFLKRKFNIPLNIQMHSDLFKNAAWTKSIESKIYAWFYNTVSLFTLKRADSVRVVSEKVKNTLMSSGIAEEKIAIIPSPIDATKFEKVNESKVKSLREKLLDKDFDKIVLFVGRLSIEKNIQLLLKAFRAVKDDYPLAKLIIVGSGKIKEKLKEDASRLGLNECINFLGSIDYSMVPYFYHSCDIFVLPSLVEGRPSVLVEAAICKKPIIVTEISGADEWVKNNHTGFIIPQDDQLRLSEKILFLLENPLIAAQFGEAGYSYSKEKLKDTNDVKLIIDLWIKTANCKNTESGYTNVQGNNKLSCAVIIPTRNRKDVLNETIASILRQTNLPQEIVIIDQSDVVDIAKEQIENTIRNNNLHGQIILKYIHDMSINSLTQAKNVSIKFAMSDILIFLDDDVILEPKYIETVLSAFNKFPDIVGVGGIVTNYRLNLWQRLYYRLFYLGPFRDLRLEICSNAKRYQSRECIYVNKLSGGLSSYKRSIFSKYKFDENYIRYSPGEDIDFSYRVSLSNKLLIVPTARAFHGSSYSAKSDKFLVGLAERHVGSWWYFYQKNINKTAFNVFCYIWINLGFLTTSIFSLVVTHDKSKLKGTILAFNKIIYKKTNFDFIKTRQN